VTASRICSAIAQLGVSARARSSARPRGPLALLARQDARGVRGDIGCHFAVGQVAQVIAVGDLDAALRLRA
jgi:hypothetical protein